MENLEKEQKQKKTTETKLTLRTRLYWKYLTLWVKLKKVKFDMEKLTINFFIGLAFFSIAIGLIIFVVFLYRLSGEYSISGDSIIMDKTGQVGDFIGGTVGAIWALTGVLLFYATLRLQSKELKENRKHFQMSRLTEIIYRQLDLFNSQLLNFKLKDIDHSKSEYVGRLAISLLRKRVESILEIHREEEKPQEKQKAMSVFMAENFAFIEINKNELFNIYEELENQVGVIRAILIKQDIPAEDLNELKSIFFRNIGRDFLNASELLIHFLDWYITFMKRQGKEIDEFFSIELSIRLKIEVIEGFRKMRYDKQTINDYLRNREMYNNTSF